MNLLLKWPWVPHPLRGGLPLQRRHPPHFAVLSCAFPARREDDVNLLVLDGFGVHPQTNLYGCGSSTPSLKNAAGMDKNWNVHNLPAGSQSHSSIQKQLNQQNQRSCWFCSHWWRKEDLAPWPMCCLHFIWMLNSRHMFALGPSRSHFFPLSSERLADCFTLRRFPTEALANPEWNLPTRHQCWWLTTRPEQWTSRIRPFLIYCLVILMKFARPVALSLHKGIHCRMEDL